MKHTHPTITLTGTHEGVNMLRLNLLALAGDVEIGFLLGSGDGLRYPELDWILNATRIVKRASLHLCGLTSRTAVMRGWIPHLGPNVQRIQINGSPTIKDVEIICELHPERTIITQHNEKNTRLLEVKAHNHALLVDASGGRGLSPKDWLAPETEKPVGFAGGLTPENLPFELQRILQVARPGWWVDMEQGLRTPTTHDGVEDSTFDVDKAVQAVTAFRNNIPPFLADYA